MILVLSSSGTTLESSVDPRFGRCAYYIAYDMDNDTFKAVENVSKNAAGGAGIQAAQAVSDMKADVVITANVGPNAYRVLEAAGVKVYSGASGTISQAIEDFKKGSLGSASSPNVGSKFGMGPGTGRGGMR